MFGLITLPSAANAIASTTEWSSALFTDLVLICVAIGGVFVAGMALAWISRVIPKALRGVFGGKKGGRGRGRR
jgi:hypothetical protein